MVAFSFVGVDGREPPGFDNSMSGGHRVGSRCAISATAVLSRLRLRMAGSPQGETDTFPPPPPNKRGTSRECPFYLWCAACGSTRWFDQPMSGEHRLGRRYAISAMAVLSRLRLRIPGSHRDDLKTWEATHSRRLAPYFARISPSTPASNKKATLGRPFFRITTAQLQLSPICDCM